MLRHLENRFSINVAGLKKSVIRELLRLTQKPEIISFAGGLPSLYELDENGGYVISIHTFSKILFPGLRLGWILANPVIIEKFVIAKQAMDLCTPPLTQAFAC